MKKRNIIKLVSGLLLTAMLPTLATADAYGQGNGSEDPSVNFVELTPAMVGIYSVRNDMSVNNVDVSSYFNLAQGSVKVSFDSVDTIRTRSGKVLFSLAGDGDNDASWHISYASDRPVKLSHGGSLEGHRRDSIVSKDGKTYRYNSSLSNGLTLKNYGHTYAVYNHVNYKLNNNHNPFEWTSNQKATSHDFEFHTNADSASGKGSSYKVFVDNAESTVTCQEQNICANTHYSILTPEMFGIYNESENISRNNVDVSSYFGMPDGSVKVSFSSVDTKRKHGVLAFSLTGKGDNQASWKIVYADERPIKLSHGGALEGRKSDGIISRDGHRYSFNNNLARGLRSSVYGDKYSVRNFKRRKNRNNHNPFEWTADTKSRTHQFDIFTTTYSPAGKGSSYKIYIDDSSCETIQSDACDNNSDNPTDNTTPSAT